MQLDGELVAAPGIGTHETSMLARFLIRGVVARRRFVVYLCIYFKRMRGECFQGVYYSRIASIGYAPQSVAH